MDKVLLGKTPPADPQKPSWSNAYNLAQSSSAPCVWDISRVEVGRASLWAGRRLLSGCTLEFLGGWFICQKRQEELNIDAHKYRYQVILRAISLPKSVLFYRWDF